MTPARLAAAARRGKDEMISRVQSRTGGVAVLHAELPLTELQRAEETALERFRRNTRWPGFRRGGVPIERVRQRFAGQAREEGLRALLQDRVPDVLSRHAIEPVGRPTVDEVAFEESRVRFRVSVECAPDLATVEWKGLLLKDPGAPVPPEAVDALVEEHRRAAAE
ncbi:MAG TPA: trigger factor family protein, partial [Elusimicrobiota bacterium]|nr:trigger factor family protein [Elusimicrobiota bacterium]